MNENLSRFALQITADKFVRLDRDWLPRRKLSRARLLSLFCARTKPILLI